MKLHNPRFALSLWHSPFDRAGTSLTLKIPQDPRKDEGESISSRFCLERLLLNPSISSSALGGRMKSRIWRRLGVFFQATFGLSFAVFTVVLLEKTRGLCEEIAGKC